MTTPFAPAPNRLQWMVMLAFPLVFVAITVSPFDTVGRWLAFALLIVANLLLWMAMVFGFYFNVYRQWRDGGTDQLDHTASPHDGDASGEPFDATERRSGAF